MANKQTHSWDRISPALEHKTKHSDKTFTKTLSKIKHKNVKLTIKNSSSVSLIKFHKLVKKKSQKYINLCDKTPQTSEKSHRNVNLCDKKSQTIFKKSEKCKLK